MRSALPLLLLAAAVLAACGTRTTPAPWAFERLAEVAADVQRDSALLQRELPLVQAALAHSVPNTDAYDPVVAVQLFERLLRQHPRSTHASLAIYLIPLLRHAEWFRVEVERERAVSEQLRAELSEAHTIADRAAADRFTSDERAAELAREAARLQRELLEREGRIQRMEQQLRGLMEIDLNPPAPLPSDPLPSVPPPG